MNDITDILRELLDRYSNTPELDQEFERMMREDEEFVKEYTVWCEENGFSLKDGYRDFINDIIESQDSYWDNYQEFGNKFPNNKRNRSFASEWDQQDGVIIAWPHAGTDWAYMLDDVTACYVDIVRAILEDDEQLVIVAPDAEDVHNALGNDMDWNRIHIVELPTNDTWVRDYGPITVWRDGGMVLTDFTFNAWGMKFAADCDNLVTSRLNEQGVFKLPLINCRDIVLEGGSIETDGNGTVMTTTCCLTAPNHNDALSREQLEQVLLERLNCMKVLWLDHGELVGDDTDGHIDTLARFAPGGVGTLCPWRGNSIYGL